MMMVQRRHPVLMLLFVLAFLESADAFAQSYALSGDENYTAQRKPRVAVMEFEDTNTAAAESRYGRAVSAMLVTYFKTQSQFVVVERQNIDAILDEWKENQKGRTNLDLDDARSELFESLDVILMGKVTLINSGIEIDAKLLSRIDARIISAAQRHGPISCLRQVVERVGIAIERSFLKPYYGSLKISLDSPQNVRIFMTPVLSDEALPEENPPVELGVTVTLGEKRDLVRPWLTHPNTYTIENILSGWYTFRLQRPGYDSFDVENSQIVAISDGDFVYNRLEKRKVRAADIMEEWVPGKRLFQKYLVHVAPLRPNLLDATDRIIHLTKKSGEVLFKVRDENDQPIPDARVRLISRDLELNPESPDPVDDEWARAADKDLEEMDSEMAPEAQPETSNTVYGQPTAEETEACTFLAAESPAYAPNPSRILRAHEPFDLEEFEGGSLAFDDYRGQRIPAGTYDAVIWAKHHKLEIIEFRVEDNDQPQEVDVILTRRKHYVRVRGRSEENVSIVGRNTGYRRDLTLNQASGEKGIYLPFDHYTIDTDVVGLESHAMELDLLPADDAAPQLEDLLPPGGARAWAREHHGPTPETELPIKSSVWVAGRFQGFRKAPGVYYDAVTTALLDRALGPQTHFNQDPGVQQQETAFLEELERRLENVDLLILDETDMSFLRFLPDMEALVRRFVDDGRALLAFVTWEGEYRSVLGAPMGIKRRTSRSSEVKLAPGEVRQFETRFVVELGTTRHLPKPRRRQLESSPWRILSYTKKKRKPRVLERGSLGHGGYTLVWLETADLEVRSDEQEVELPDEPEKLTKSARKELEKLVFKRLKARADAREADHRLKLAKSMLMGRALLWAEYLMYREFDSEQTQLHEARQRLVRAGAR